jgi:simple sugar transport system ATP-binding protein
MQSTAAQREVIAQARGVTKQYPGVLALDDVDFMVHAGEVRALLGANGAGKSTLIRMLAGVEVPDSGAILLQGSELGGGGVRGASERGVATVFQELSLIPGLSVAENLFLGRWPRSSTGIDYRAMYAASDRVLASLGVSIEPSREVASLTLAEQQIVEIARALREEPRLLILDEPTSALAAAEVALVLRTVRTIAESGVGVIFVSHRMDEIRTVADAITVMRDGRVVASFDSGSATTDDVVRAMLGDRERTAALAARTSHDVGDVLLRVEGLRIPPKIASASFEVRAGEVVGIAGLLGSGRTELLRAIAGHDRTESGTVTVNGHATRRPRAARMRRLGVGLTPENRKRDGVILEMGVDENIVMSDYPTVSTRGVLSARKIVARTEGLRDRLQIKVAALSAPVANLSGGNQQKVVIGRWLYAGSSVLLLDEPTRGVDVEAKAQIYRIMRTVADNGAAVVFVSSEIEELPLVCDRVLVLRRGEIAEQFIAPDIDLTKLLAASMAASA